MNAGPIHFENPFADPVEGRDPARRFRGRFAAGVAILTAGAGDARTGLTVSSLLVAEGEPPRILALVNDGTDLWYALEADGRFLVHICEADHRELADRFAGLRPSPGGLFAGLEVTDTDHGPLLGGFGTVARCRMEAAPETGYHRLVTATIDGVALSDLTDPLVWFRGAYRRLAR